MAIWALCYKMRAENKQYKIAKADLSYMSLQLGLKTTYNISRLSLWLAGDSGVWTKRNKMK